MLNACPALAAVSKELRKLSACAALRNGSFHVLPSIFHRTQ
jgi:hypothetical protein